VQLPLESVTVVVLPSDALLVEKLPEPPDWVTVPPGPVVVPVTLPPPAVIEVDMPELVAPGALSPFLSSTTLQFLSFEDVLLLLEPVPALAVELLLELVCAEAAATLAAATARNATSVFTWIS
jgi:hypothetical protein